MMRSQWKKAAAVLLPVAIIFAAGVGARAGDGHSLTEMKKEYRRPAAIPFPEDNPFTVEKQRLGQSLFFDPRLSGNNAMSCATCHNPGLSWGDGLARSFGAKGALDRRTPTILNLAWAEALMWDGRQESLESQALGPIEAAVEMNQDVTELARELSAIPGYRTAFEVAFPGEGIRPETIAKALATYQRTVVSPMAPFDRWIAGDEEAIGPAAKRGFVLFNTKGHCAACHSGWNLTDHSFHDIGLPDNDIGRGAFVPLESMKNAFKTPTLRDVARRAPYMHNGSLTDLSAVMDHYIAGGAVKRPSLSADMRPLDLNAQEKADIIAFMLSLTSDTEPVPMPALPVATPLPVPRL